MTGENMRGTTTDGPGTSTIICGRSELDTDKTKLVSGGNANTRSEPYNSVFPSNTGQMLPLEYYSQFHDWYSQMMKQPRKVTTLYINNLREITISRKVVVLVRTVIARQKI